MILLQSVIRDFNRFEEVAGFNRPFQYFTIFAGPFIVQLTFGLTVRTARGPRRQIKSI
jgi:hypothetical protein